MADNGNGSRRSSVVSQHSLASHGSAAIADNGTGGGATASINLHNVHNAGGDSDAVWQRLLMDGVDPVVPSSLLLRHQQSNIVSTTPKMQISASSSMGSDGFGQMRSLPNQTVILERLSKIREHKRQVLDMMDKLKRNGEEIDKDTLRKLVTAYDNFKEQEEQYLGVLQKILVLKQNFTSTMEESGFQSDVPSESSEQPMVTVRAEDVHNGNHHNRPIIEDKVGVFHENQLRSTVPPANVPPNNEDDETDELQALIEQRNMLQKMLRQQEEMRALQGRHAAQQGLKETASQQTANRPPTVGRPPVNEKEYLATRQEVDQQGAVLAAKRRELEEMKQSLDSVRELYGESSSSDMVTRTEDGLRRQRELEDKLRLLKGKKQRMDDILSQLSGFQQTTDHAISAENNLPDQNGVASVLGNDPRAQFKTDNNLESVNDNYVDKRAMLQEKYEELIATKKRISDVKQMIAHLEQGDDNAGGVITGNREAELLKFLDQQMQPPQPPARNAANAHASMNQQMRESYEAKINEQEEAVFNLQNEHQRLLAIKQQLLSMNDDQLRHLGVTESAGTNKNRQSDSPASQVVRSNDEVWRELRAQAIQREENFVARQSRTVQQQLNNTKDNVSDYSFNSRSKNARGPVAADSVAATFGSFVGDDDTVDVDENDYRNNNNNNSNIKKNISTLNQQQQQQQQSRSSTNPNMESSSSAADGIVRNPLLASFRRNNNIQQDVQRTNSPNRSMTHNHNQVVSASVTSQQQRQQSKLPSSSMTSRNVQQQAADVQYDQLQQHIDSIRSIFDTLIKDRQATDVLSSAVGANSQQQQQQASLNLLQSLFAAPSAVNVLNPSALAVQQQQLTVSLLSCQQQLQLQQIEMRYLQQLCHDLMTNNQQQQQRVVANAGDMAASDPTPLTQQQQHERSRSASFAQSVSNVPVAAMVVPQLDGRPLSSASLYNLLAPNPYLTFPYYPPQFQPNIVASPKNLLNNSFYANNMSMTLPLRGMNNKSPSMTNAPPPMTGGHQHLAYHNQHHYQQHQRHHSAMEQGNVSDCSDRSMTNVKTAVAPSAGDTPSKGHRPLGGAAAAANSVVPKLDFDSLYKSNVAKKQKNFDTAQQAINEVAEANMSRVSSIASGATGGGATYCPDANLSCDQFDALREMIYSEVATLISQNEQRPHYLLELFRELQLLSSDHLRTRALQAIREVLNRYLTDDTDGNDTEFEYRNVAASANVHHSSRPPAVEETQTESAWTSDDEAFRQRRTFVPLSSRDKAHDFSETACSGSTVSTPDQSNAFTIDGLTQTVIHYEKPVTARQKRFEHLEDIKDVKNGPLNNETVHKPVQPSSVENITNNSTGAISRIQNRNDIIAEELANRSSQIDVSGLEHEIRTIVDELIPFVRDNAKSACSPQLLQYLRKLALTLTIAKCQSSPSGGALVAVSPTAASASTPTSAEAPFFNRQLATILDETLSKFNGLRLEECCEDILASISEVIFSELAYYRLMKNIDTNLGASLGAVGHVKHHENFTDQDAIEHNNQVPVKPVNLISSASGRTNLPFVPLSVDRDFANIDDDEPSDMQIFGGGKSQVTNDDNSAANFLTRTPSESCDTTPYEELRDVADTLEFIDDDFQRRSKARHSANVLKEQLNQVENLHEQKQAEEVVEIASQSRTADEDIDKDEMSIATTENSSSIRNVPVVQNGPTTSSAVAQLCDAE